MPAPSAFRRSSKQAPVSIPILFRPVTAKNRKRPRTRCAHGAIRRKRGAATIGASIRRDRLFHSPQKPRAKAADPILKMSASCRNNGCVLRARASGSFDFLSDSRGESMNDDNALRKTEEWRSFIFLTVVMVPVLTVALIAVYGFIVWFYQMLIGGPPHH
jgi:periplasmic nitrate reductase NapE